MKGVSPTMYRKQIQQDENRVNREHLKQVEEFISKVGEARAGRGAVTEARRGVSGTQNV